MDQFEKAMNDFNKAIELDPTIADFYQIRGIAHETMGDLSAAQADFAKYKEISGEDVP